MTPKERRTVKYRTRLFDQLDASAARDLRRQLKRAEHFNRRKQRPTPALNAAEKGETR